MLGTLSHSHYMALAFGGTFLINEPSLQTTSLFSSSHSMLVAFSESRQQALSPPFAAHYPFAADRILLPRPTRKRDTAENP